MSKRSEVFDELDAVLKRSRQQLDEDRQSIETERQLLNESKKAHEEERLEWEHAQERSVASVPDNSQWHYNIGGTRFWLSSPQMLVYPNSIFGARARGNFKREHTVCLDRCPKMFALICELIRVGADFDYSQMTDREKERFKVECEFYGISLEKAEDQHSGIPVQYLEWTWETHPAVQTSPCIVPIKGVQDTIFRLCVDPQSSNGWMYARGPALLADKAYEWSVHLGPDSHAFDVGLISNLHPISDYANSFTCFQYVDNLHVVIEVRHSSIGRLRTYHERPNHRTITVSIIQPHRKAVISLNGVEIAYRNLQQDEVWHPYFGFTSFPLEVSKIQIK